MNVSTITMPKEQARAKLKAYRANTHKDAEGIYRQCAEAYERLADGTPLIELSKAIQAGGFFPEMRPKLAIARADRKEVEFRWDSYQEWCQFDTAATSSYQNDSLTIRIAMGRKHGLTRKVADGHEYGISAVGYAMIPMVPADIRPATGQLKDWHILWEVEHWSDTRQTARAPRDPILLEHVGGDLWAVLAEWDLTELERAILQGSGQR